MQWQYRTILFEFQKDGLLGDKYIDDEDVEATLNEQGVAGWELVNVALIQEGLLSFFKRPASSVPRVTEPASAPPAEAPPSTPEPRQEPEPVITAESIKEQEREHIRRLGERTLETDSSEDDTVGSIRIS